MHELRIAVRLKTLLRIITVYNFKDLLTRPCISDILEANQCHLKLGVSNNFVKTRYLLHTNELLIFYRFTRRGHANDCYTILYSWVELDIGEMVSRRLSCVSVEFSKLLLVNFLQPFIEGHKTLIKASKALVHGSFIKTS